MGWIIVLVGVVLLVVLIRKSIDRETTRNFKLLGKVLAGVVAVIILWVVISYISR